MLGRVRQRKDHRALIDSRHRLDNFLIEGPANRADTNDRGRLDALDGSDEIPGWRVQVSVRLLEVEQVSAGCVEKTVDVEHVAAALRVFEAHALCNERGTQ